MTRRERLERLYQHKEVDRPAVYSRSGFPWNDPSYNKLKALLKEKTELKHVWNASAILSDIPRDSEVIELTGDFYLHVETMHTPTGDLTSETMIGRPGSSVQGHDMVRKHFITSVEDARKYLSCGKRVQIISDFSSFYKCEDEVGEAGITDILLGSNPAGTVAELCGTELFALWSIEERELLHELCCAEQQKQMQLCRILVDNKIGPYYSTLGHEYITPPIHGLKDFQDFITRYDKPIIDLLKNAGGWVHVHCHGSIATVFDEFIKLGVDVLHPFESPPMGDITAADAKKRSKGLLTLEGNIQIADMYEKTPDDIRAQVRELIRDVFYDHQGLIVSASASPYMFQKGGMCLENYAAMIDEVTR